MKTKKKKKNLNLEISKIQYSSFVISIGKKIHEKSAAVYMCSVLKLLLPKKSFFFQKKKKKKKNASTYGPEEATTKV